MKIDMLLCWPRDIFYPYFVDLINKNRHLFNKVIVVMTQKADNRDYIYDIKKYIKDATVLINYPYKGLDWRQDAIIEGLYETRGSHVLFFEQDFLVMDGFFEQLFERGKYFQVAGFRDGERFHPACLLVTQEAIASTEKDFSVQKDVGDHFYKFTKQLEKLNNWASLGFLNLPDYYHMAGLTQNYRLTDNFYCPHEFFTYNDLCLNLPMPDSWRKFLQTKHISEYIPDEKIKKFFI